MKDPPYGRAYHDQHGGYRKESRKGKQRGKTGKGHPKTMDGEREQRPDEQCLGQAVDNRNRLETAAFGVPVIKVHSLSNVKVNYRRHVE
jgi:hypothetical protein